MSFLEGFREGGSTLGPTVVPGRSPMRRVPQPDITVDSPTRRSNTLNQIAASNGRARAAISQDVRVVAFATIAFALLAIPLWLLSLKMTSDGWLPVFESLLTWPHPVAFPITCGCISLVMSVLCYLTSGFKFAATHEAVWIGVMAVLSTLVFLASSLVLLVTLLIAGAVVGLFVMLVMSLCE